MKILVLGSSGQIGKPTCRILKNLGFKVFEYDIQNDEKQDLRNCEYAPLLSDYFKRCDFVLYLASDVGGAKYLEEKEHSYQFIQNNIRIMANVFDLLKRYNKPFIFTSSQMAELSHSTYGQMKLLGEKMANELGGLVVRLWNVYGKEEDEEKSHVITDFCNMAKQGVIKMRTDGEESRQFLFADDCVEAFVELIKQYDSLDKTKNYHITSFDWISVLHVAEIIQDISGCEIVRGERKDNTQKNARNEPDPYILKYWQPKTCLLKGILKIFNS